jgi:hypothetical protein
MKRKKEKKKLLFLFKLLYALFYSPNEEHEYEESEEKIICVYNVAKILWKKYFYRFAVAHQLKAPHSCFFYTQVHIYNFLPQLLYEFHWGTYTFVWVYVWHNTQNIMFVRFRMDGKEGKRRSKKEIFSPYAYVKKLFASFFH